MPFIKRIIILFLAYGDSHILSGLRKVSLIANSMFPDSEIHVVLIQNNLNCFLARENYCMFNNFKSFNCIYGDNTLFEFSGWDHGFNYVKDKFNPSSHDLILYVNDTFHRRNYKDGGSSFLEFFNADIIEGLEDQEFALGYLDDFPRPVKLFNIEYSSWIRSNIFILSYSIAKRIHPLQFPLSKNLIFNDQGVFFKDTELISANWRAYISSWLFAEKSDLYPEYSLNWIKSQPLSDGNRIFFQKKALAILSEHYLSARLHAQQIIIIDANKFLKRVDRHTTPYYEEPTK